MVRIFTVLLGVALVIAGCSDSDDTTVSTGEATAPSTAAPPPDPPDATAEAPDDDPAADEAATADESNDDAAADDASAANETATDETVADDAGGGGAVEAFQIEVWADNWMAVYVDGTLIGEDSVSITTERSFNSETFTFDASYPFTLAIEARDFKETDSGLEYIGERNQQMGDGGIIAQVTDSSGAVVAVTNSAWEALVVHRAPLNPECESDADPNQTCQFEILDTPSDWTAPDFDTTGWVSATEWSAQAVDPKDGYDLIAWDATAQLIWGEDLEVDNTILLRTTVG